MTGYSTFREYAQIFLNLLDRSYNGSNNYKYKFYLSAIFQVLLKYLNREDIEDDDRFYDMLNIIGDKCEIRSEGYIPNDTFIFDVISMIQTEKFKEKIDSKFYGEYVNYYNDADNMTFLENKFGSHNMIQLLKYYSKCKARN
jgi:hypothetical protein